MASSLRWDDLNFIRELGDGHAGTVWLASLKRPANGLSTNDPVAVKRFKRWVLQEAGHHERVFRELAASIKVRHPHIVHNIGLVSDPEGLPALVMRYYEGKTLESFLADGRSNNNRTPIADAFQLLGALMDAVQALHDAGIYHRDIKPANIFVEENSHSPIVMDLGVVSEFLLAEQAQTIDFLGTIRYADPNYLRGDQFNAASDWYSLGLVAYELFFGTRFLAFEEQWARLVALKLSRQLPSKEDLAENYSKLSELFGQDASEAAFYALTTLLSSATPERLARLRAAISRAFWTEPFFEGTDGEVIRGEPSMVPAFRFECGYGQPDYHSATYTSASEESLETALLRLSSIKSDSGESISLSETIKNNYWKWKMSGLDDIYDRRGRWIDIVSIYAGGGGDDTTYDTIYLNAGILALYRYGYI